MSNFKERLEKEIEELSERVVKLNYFLESHESQKIDPIQLDLLIIQSGAMETYLSCLETRFDRL
jgi:hypothetical protein